MQNHKLITLLLVGMFFALLSPIALAVPFPIGVAGVFTGTNEANFTAQISALDSSTNAIITTKSVQLTSNYRFATALTLTHTDYVDIRITISGGSTNSVTGQALVENITAGQSIYISVAKTDKIQEQIIPEQQQEIKEVPEEDDEKEGLAEETPVDSSVSSQDDLEELDADKEKGKNSVSEEPGLLEEPAESSITVVEIILLVLLVVDFVFIFLLIKKKKIWEQKSNKNVEIKVRQYPPPGQPPQN